MLTRKRPSPGQLEGEVALVEVEVLSERDRARSGCGRSLRCPAASAPCSGARRARRGSDRAADSPPGSGCRLAPFSRPSRRSRYSFSRSIAAPSSPSRHPAPRPASGRASAAGGSGVRSYRLFRVALDPGITRSGGGPFSDGWEGGGREGGAGGAWPPLSSGPSSHDPRGRDERRRSRSGRESSWGAG